MNKFIYSLILLIFVALSLMNKIIDLNSGSRDLNKWQLNPSKTSYIDIYFFIKSLSKFFSFLFNKFTLIWCNILLFDIKILSFIFSISSFLFITSFINFSSCSLEGHNIKLIMYKKFSYMLSLLILYIVKNSRNLFISMENNDIFNSLIRKKCLLNK